MKLNILLVLLVLQTSLWARDMLRDTFQPLHNDNAPQTVDELWQDFDPRAEPLDIKVLYEWEEDNVIMHVLRYRIGVFKGEEAKMAAIYGYPKGAANLPGLVQIHGGGQYADYRAVLTNAKRGYATISISWAGRINAPDYHVNPDIVKLFWDGDTTHPDYKVTTDWGAVDGYHAPSRNPENSFVSIPVAPWTLDTIESPRNNSWFLCAVGARRALTFLEQQPQVNPDKLGVYGHSMGGKLTVMTSIDDRVKAAAPSCGGVSDRYNENQLYQSTLGDVPYLKNISCPIFLLSPSNDFHGKINDLQKALEDIETDEWRVTCSAHHNHQDNAECEVTGLLWFDQHLKGTFNYPDTPESSLELKTKNGVPCFSVTPDNSKPIKSVDIFYTQQGDEIREKTDRDNSINRFWHHAKTTKKGGTWSAELPILSTAKPLWAYANVLYQLDEPVTGAGYYYRIYTADTFNLSSKMYIANPQQLLAAGVKATAKPSLMIETFKGDWEKEWFTYRNEKWGRRTHKVYSEKYKAPENSRLAIKVKTENPNKLVIGIDDYATEIQLSASSKWHSIVLSPSDFKNVRDEILPNWNGIKELRFGAQETLRVNRDETVKPKKLGAEWDGPQPEFKDLQWIKETN